jgi:hypothetical protein
MSRARYVGAWHENKEHGLGTCTWGEGNRSFGDFDSGEFTGHGLRTQDRISYVGRLASNVESGSGVTVWPVRKIFVQPVDDRQVAMKYPAGSMYVGDWDGALWHGQGSRTWPDGSKYVGAFVAGKRHGWGVQMDASGHVFAAKWQNDKAVR